MDKFEPPWKSIDTAPRDGTQILVCAEGFDESISVFWQEKTFKNPAGWCSACCEDSYYDVYIQNPLCWTELPLPPVQVLLLNQGT